MTAILCTMYGAVRLWRLDASCLWFDEIFSVHAAEHSWNSIFSFVAQDLIHPPLFYVFLKLWIGIGGEGVFWLRLLPVFFSVAALIPFLLLARELKLGRWVTVLGLFLIAFNGSLIKYAQEVRMYSLLMCVSLFSIWLFSRYFTKGKSLVPLIIINIVMVYSHYYGWFVVVSEVAAIVIFQRIKIRAILIMVGSTLLAFLPWALAVFSYARAGAEVGQNIGWMQKPSPMNIIQLILSLIEPFYYAASSIDAFSVYRITLPLIGIAIVVTVFFFYSSENSDHGGGDKMRLPLIFAVTPVIIAFAASWLLPHSIWGTRHLIVIFVPTAVVAAVMIASVGQKTVRIAAISLIVLFTGYAFMLTAQRETTQYSWCAWEPLAVEAKSVSNSNIYAFEDLIAYHLWFSQRNRQTRPEILRVTNIDGLVEDGAYFLPRGFGGVKKLDFLEINEPRIWIAWRAGSIEEKEPPLRNFLVKGYHVIDQKEIVLPDERAILVLLEK